MVPTRSPLNGASLAGYSQFNRRTLNNYWRYADEFVLGDRMFSPRYGPTFPEHLYTVAAKVMRFDQPLMAGLGLCR